ncbi:MAG: transcription-repair coupling factor, partial [Bdellovibrionales bacterium]|nr:transcription-repair coupling factor [Bdellovibrionales bacterium]
KQIRREVDVLTLTATPIPRTLHMSLLGIRDLSVIETPPTDRQVIRTYVSPYEDSIVREAILRELGREGQVFYIHNRVSSIFAVAEELRQLVPEARIGVGHGQMRERELSQVMHQFVTGAIDVLVSTTIVESGLDIPNANTIIIRRADAFGLAELYQLRGRVGRSSRRAYAYLLVADPAKLGSNARRRLEVLQALDDLGVGFRLALQDMEIRGAGNLLGKDQSGQINLVGFELYSKILKDAILELRLREEGGARPAAPLWETEMQLGFPTHVPPTYMPDVADRLLLYQRLVELQDEAEAQTLVEDLEDRYGNLPRDVVCLVEGMIFRSELRRAGIQLAQYRDSQLRIRFHPDVSLSRQRLLAVIAGSKGRYRLTPNEMLLIDLSSVKVNSPRDLTVSLRALLLSIGDSTARTL